MKTLLAIALVAAQSALSLGAGETAPFTPYDLQDQHGNEHHLKPETRIVVMAFEMSLAKKIHTWLATKEPDYLASRQAEYVVDISPMPGIITTLFAGPKMRRYPFPIIQATSDDFAAAYPHEEGKITIFRLNDDQKQATFHYVATTDEIEAELESARSPDSPDATP